MPKSLKCPIEVFIEHPRPEAQSFLDLYKELNLRQLIENCLKAKSNIIKKDLITKSGRIIYEFDAS